MGMNYDSQNYSFQFNLCKTKITFASLSNSLVSNKQTRSWLDGLFFFYHFNIKQRQGIWKIYFRPSTCRHKQDFWNWRSGMTWAYPSNLYTCIPPKQKLFSIQWHYCCHLLWIGDNHSKKYMLYIQDWQLKALAFVRTELVAYPCLWW